jgi:hypothetical protein
MIRVDKKQNKLWARRMHTSLKCYKENLILLFIFEKRLRDQEMKQSQEVITSTLSNIDMNAKKASDDDELIDLDDFTKPIKKLTDLRSSSSISITPITPEPPKNVLNEKSIHLLTKLKGFF